MNLLFLLLPTFASSTFISEIRPIREVVQGFGYGLEPHTVVTSDGYKLMVHRLLGRELAARIARSPLEDALYATAPSNEDTDYGIPVLIVEGVLQSSASNLAKGKGIAYSLVDKGYDVWLANYRGNMYSRDHVTLSPDEPRTKFWDFTLHEMGTKDLPALIDHVLKTTHRQQLLYLGFSMGTTMFWIMSSILPEYQTKVSAIVAVGPVARPSNMAVVNNSFFRNTLKIIFSGMLALDYCEIMSYNMKTASVIRWVCNQKFSFLCENFISNINYLQKTETEIAEAFKLIPYSPSGIATKVVLHFLQIADEGRFQQFDYGEKGNFDRYGTAKPPEYDLNKVTLPVYLVYSDSDEVAKSQDVEWLAQQLPRRPERKLQDTVNTFGHVDFSLNVNLETLFTRPLTSLISQLADEHRAALARVASEPFANTSNLSRDNFHS